MANEFTGLRGALVYTNAGHRFDGVPIHIAQTVLSRALGMGHVGYAEDYFEGDTQMWTFAETSDGPASNSATFGSSQVDGTSQRYGVLEMTTANGLRARAEAQLRGPSFRYEVGKRMWVFARYRMSTGATTSAAFGLSVTTASFLIGGLRGSTGVPATGLAGQFEDGIFFTKQATQTRWDLAVRKNGAETRVTQPPSVAIENDNFREIGVYVDRAGMLHYYVDSQEFSTASIAAGSANIPNDTDLRLSIAVGNDVDISRRLGFDWIIALQDSNV